MAQITLEYDARNKFAQSFVETLRRAGCFKEVKEPRKKKCGLDLALEDVRAGRVYKAKDADDMIKQILG